MTLEISGQHGTGEIIINSHCLQGPARFENIEVIDEKVILNVAKRSETDRDCDFDIPSLERNIVALNGDGEVIWIVSEGPDQPESDDITYYRYIFTIQGDLYATGTNDKLYKINHDTGKKIGSYESGILPIDDELISLDGKIVNVVEFDDKIFVRGGALYGFDAEGNQLWKSEEYRGRFYKDDDILIEGIDVGPWEREYYRLNPETGERLAEIEIDPLSKGGPKYVKDVSDSE